jgi:hypothetical protein
MQPKGSAIPTALLNGISGPMLVAKVIVPLFPDTARNLFPCFRTSRCHGALRGHSRHHGNSPRSAGVPGAQSVGIDLAGLESRTQRNHGALVH